MSNDKTVEPLTDEQIDKIAADMPDGLGGMLKTWGYRQFARALLAATFPPSNGAAQTDVNLPQSQAQHQTGVLPNKAADGVVPTYRTEFSDNEHVQLDQDWVRYQNNLNGAPMSTTDAFRVGWFMHASHTDAKAATSRWQIVPAFPTPQMHSAGVDADEEQLSVDSIYCAMLAAAPASLIEEKPVLFYREKGAATWIESYFHTNFQLNPRPVEPGTFPLAYGATSRVGRLRAYGNAVNAIQAQIFIETKHKSDVKEPS